MRSPGRRPDRNNPQIPGASGMDAHQALFKDEYWMTGYDAMIGEDDFDWETLIRTCVEVGGTKVLTIEYGNRNRYQPFYGAYLCYTKLKDIVNNM